MVNCMKCQPRVTPEQFSRDISSLPSNLDIWYDAVNIVHKNFSVPLTEIFLIGDGNPSYSLPRLQILKQQGYLTPLWAEYLKIKKRI